MYWASALPLVKMPLAFLPAAFATLLLTKVSGIPFSERSRAKRLANDDKFKEYSKKTSKLVPGLY